MPPHPSATRLRSEGATARTRAACGVGEACQEPVRERASAVRAARRAPACGGGVPRREAAPAARGERRCEHGTRGRQRGEHGVASAHGVCSGAVVGTGVADLAGVAAAGVAPLVRTVGVGVCACVHASVGVGVCAQHAVGRRGGLEVRLDCREHARRRAERQDRARAHVRARQRGVHDGVQPRQEAVRDGVQLRHTRLRRGVRREAIVCLRATHRLIRALAAPPLLRLLVRPPIFLSLPSPLLYSFLHSFLH